MRQEQGFTLTELLVTVTIAALLMTIGVPALKETFAASRHRTAVHAMYTGAMIARSEAMKAGLPVAFGRRSNDWTDRVVWRDSNHNCVVDAGEQIISEFSERLDETVKITPRGTTAAPACIRFSGRGWIDITASSADQANSANMAMWLSACDSTGKYRTSYTVYFAGAIVRDDVPVCP